MTGTQNTHYYAKFILFKLAYDFGRLLFGAERLHQWPYSTKTAVLVLDIYSIWVNSFPSSFKMMTGKT